MGEDPIKILLVDDQPSKLLSYKTILDELGEALLTAGSAKEAFQILLKNDVAVVLIDVCMPETDGFELAAMIREHPRFEKTALIFISAVVFDDIDRLRGYEVGAVDYVSVPIIPEVLRAKVKVFVELHRKTQALERLNRNLEARVAERTAELAASMVRLRQAEQLRSLALAAGQMGSWEWNVAEGAVTWDQGQHEIFGVDPADFTPTGDAIRALIFPRDLKAMEKALHDVRPDANTFQTEFQVRRPDGEARTCVGVAAASFDEEGNLARISGVTVDVTERNRAEERQYLLAQEVDHRARNVVSVIQAIMRLTRAPTIDEYIAALEGRIGALSTAHKLLAHGRWEGADLGALVAEEMAPYEGCDGRVDAAGPHALLPPALAQTIGLALHELATNAVKYGALSTNSGRIKIRWAVESGDLHLSWTETGGPKVKAPERTGYGIRVIKGGVESHSGGEVSFDWLADGLSCVMSLRHAPEDRLPPERPANRRNEEAVATLADEQGVLVVEDEPLVSMMLADMLSENGYKVDGPYDKSADALAAAAVNDLYGGILDINLGNDTVYPIAERLAERKIPFVFITGYGQSSVDARFSHVTVLQKPVDPKHVQAALAAMQRRARSTIGAPPATGDRRGPRRQCGS